MTGILDGLDDAGDAIFDAINDIIEDGFQAFRDEIVGGLYDNLVVKIFALDNDAGFMLLFAIFLFAFFFKFVYWPMRS